MATKKQKTSQRKKQNQPKGGRELTLAQLLKKRRNRDNLDFKPDARTATWTKTARLTKQQQLRLTKWVFYMLTVVLCQVVQDVIMSQISIFGATTDLAVCAILLITVIEGTEIGSIFVLLVSLLYYFSGTAPSAWCIGLMTVFGICATLFRQLFWHRSKGSLILCATIALIAYEIGLFVVGVGSGLTHLGRAPVFLLTAVYSCFAMIPLYPLIHKIGLIGGNTWKE